MNTPLVYPLAMRLMHWAMAIIILSLLFLGVSMVDSLAPWQNTALQMHKMLGLTALVLVVLRLILRLRLPTPALPEDLSAVQKVGAKGAHILLYCAMLAMPLSGWAMQSAAGNPVVLPWGTALPALAPQSLKAYGLMREIHGLVAWLFIALVVAHIAAALHHKLVRRDGVLSTMTGCTSRHQ